MVAWLGRGYTLQAEIRRLLCELEQLKEKTVRSGHTQFAARLAAMSQAARQVISPAAATEVIAVLDATDTTAAAATAVVAGANCLENGPSSDHSRVNKEQSDVDLRQRKTGHSVKEKIKSPKNIPDSGTLKVCPVNLSSHLIDGMIDDPT